MQNLLMGPSGGGKSYEACVYHILPALNKGRKVITNLPVNVEFFEAICSGAEDLLELRGDKGGVRAFSRAHHFGSEWRHPETGAGPLYVIDECHKAFPRGKTDQAVEEWFAEHRHESCDVLLITQSYGKISKAIVDNMQLIYRCRKAVALGSSKRYVKKVQDGVRGEVLNTTTRTYDPKYFKLYTSHTKGGGAEMGAEDVVPIWKHWSFKASAVCLIGLLFLLPRLQHPFKPPQHKAEQTASAAVEAQPVTPAKAQPQAQQASSPAAQPQQETQRSKLHPFEGYGLHLAAIMHGKRDGHDVLKGLLRVTQNGQVVNTMNLEDLVKAGYSFETAGDCVLSLSYKGLDLGFVVCDAPKIGLAGKIPGNSKAEG